MVEFAKEVAVGHVCARVTESRVSDRTKRKQDTDNSAKTQAFIRRTTLAV